MSKKSKQQDAVRAAYCIQIERRMRRERRWVGRIFRRWLDKNKSRFVFDLTFQMSKDNCFRIRLIGVTSVIYVHLGSAGISANAYINDECVDIIADFDSFPEATAEGYVCPLCTADVREPFPTLEQFWCRHIFDRFLSWVNNELASARWLNVVCTDGGGSVRLCNDDLEAQEHQHQFNQLMSRLRKIDGSPSCPDGTANFEITNIPVRQHLRGRKPNNNSLGSRESAQEAMR